MVPSVIVKYDINRCCELVSNAHRPHGRDYEYQISLEAHTKGKSGDLHIINPLISFTFLCSILFLNNTTRNEAQTSKSTPNATGMSQYSGDRCTEPPNTTCNGGG